MRLVADASCLFSALLKRGLSRMIFSDARVSLFAPRSILVEFEKYAAELRAKSGLGEQDFMRLSKLLLSRINFVPDAEIAPFLPAASHICPDPKDVAYVAAALSIGADVWSRDRKIRHPRIRVWSTSELGANLGLL